jgi:hypothetical protein
MGAAKLKATRATDYFLSTLFAREDQAQISMEHVVAHEIGHAIANILLDYPIEFFSIAWRLDRRIEGFTKNAAEAIAAAEASMRGNDRGRALQLTAIQFAGPLAEYRSHIRRSSNAKAISHAARSDKMESFRLFCYSNSFVGQGHWSYDTGDVSFSDRADSQSGARLGARKIDAYALAKSILESPGAFAAMNDISASILGRLRPGSEVKMHEAEIRAVLLKHSPK